MRDYGATWDGRTFQRLTVLHEADRRTPANKRVFVCRCECGKEKEVIGASLTSGRTTSCGCRNAETSRTRSAARASDLTGQRFGRLVVLEDSGLTAERTDGRSNRLWLCLCDCGKQAMYHASPLKFGQTKTCGCGQAERAAALGAASRDAAQRVKVFGEPVAVTELARLADFTPAGLRHRLGKGMTPEAAAFGPRRAKSRAVSPRRKRRRHKCRKCGVYGHNARTCKKGHL